MVQLCALFLLVSILCLATASSSNVVSRNNLAVSPKLKKRSKKTSTSIVASGKISRKKGLDSKKNALPTVVAQAVVARSGLISKVRSRLPFSKPILPPVPKVTGPPPSSLAKINILMLMFYTTLGAAMPYIPLYYRNIGLSSKFTVWYNALFLTHLKSYYIKSYYIKSYHITSCHIKSIKSHLLE